MAFEMAWLVLFSVFFTAFVILDNISQRITGGGNYLLLINYQIIINAWVGVAL